ncbi:MAG: VanZ family protein [Agathobacter sp.]
MQLIFQYIFKMLPFCFIGFVLCLIIRIVFLNKKKAKILIKNEFILCVFTAYCFGLASQTIMPHWNCGIDSTTGKPFLDVFWTNNLASVNLIPLKSIIEQLCDNNSVVAQEDIASVSMLNLMANLLLFLPLGFFVPLLWGKFNNVKKIVYLGIGVSALVEFIQMFVGRSTDIDDVILNTIGVLIGFLIFRLLKMVQMYKEH